MDYSNPHITADDIVFAERNQAYGAFNLRKIYNDTVIKAFSTSALVFLLCLVGPLIAEKLKPEEEEVVEEEVKIDPKLIQPPPMDPKTPPPPPVNYSAPPPPPVSTVKFVPPVMVDDDKVVEEDPPKQEDLTTKVAATETREGDPNADPNQIIVEGPAGTGEGTGIAAPVEEEVFLVVEQQPSFPGGEAAMMKFIRDNIKYPPAAIKAEVQGTVYVEFIVNSDGHLSDYKVLRGQGMGLDEAAIDVAKKMPDWQPGKNQGKSVKVRVSIPIKFRLAG